MAIAQGVAKKLAFKKETTWGTAPVNDSTAQFLRRVTSDLDVEKDTYQSQEIRTDYQISDFRHGGRRVTGTISGELSPGTYAKFIQSALRRDFATVSAITSLTLTVAGSGPTYTVTRSAGDWIAGGITPGMVVRITAGLANAANINKNLFVVTVTATILTVIPLNGVAMAAEGPTGSSTLTIPGKVTYTPTTGHTNDSYSIEHYFSDLVLSEVFTGCRVNTIAMNLPATGMATIDTSFLGKDVTTAGSQYFSSASAATTSGCLAAVNGILRAGGVTVGVVTGLNLNINGNASSVPVVGSNFSPDVFIGRVNVSGQMNALFDSATLRDAFLNETEISMQCAMATSSLALAEFISFNMPRLKVGGARKNDGETGLSLTLPFQAILGNAAGAGTAELTTLMVHDSLAP